MTLTTTIANLLRQAQQDPNTIREIRLKRGLILGVKWNRQYTTLRLQRNGGSAPSTSEWQTVVNNWPYPLTGIEGPQSQNNGHSLVGRWPSPVQVDQLQMLPGQEA